MINIADILKDYPKGTKLYSPLYGGVKLEGVRVTKYYTLIDVINLDGKIETFYGDGRYYDEFPESECLLFPSKDNRDWDKFQIPVEPKFKVGDRIRHKKLHVKYRVTNVTNDTYIVETLNDNHIYHMSIKCVNDCYEIIPNKFNISTLKPFDKVLVRDLKDEYWNIGFFSFQGDKHLCTARGYYAQCIPYEGNEHLLGTTNDCDEYYKNWE